MLNIWTQPSGYSFVGISGITGTLAIDSARTTFDGSSTTFDEGSYQERVVVNIPLPVTGNLSSDTFRLISGALPPGLRIEGSAIVGVPYGVVRTTKYTFCIRAQRGSEIADRTYNLTINGGQLPVIVTPSGLLPVGRYGQKFVVGNSLVDYQLSAYDPDGENLTYFIASGDGKLPPGLKLTSDGKLTGIAEPVPSVVAREAGTGTYDESFYDTSYYDFGLRSTNGYDSFIFDTVDYDYNTPTRVPRSVNQTYEFLVSISTGSVTVKRKFSIFVVGEDSFFADYTQISDDTTLFTADVTFLKQPLWITDNNLGVCRADNYVTFALETLEIVDSYPIVFTIDNVNNLPPGLTFNPVGNKVYLAGRIPFQPSIAKSYTFTVRASREAPDEPAVSTSRTFVLRVLGDIDNRITWVTPYKVGSISANFVSELEIKADSTAYSNLIYSKISGNLPPGLTLSSNGEINGKVNQYGVPNIERATSLDNGNLTFDNLFTTIDNNHQYDIVGVRGLILFDSNTTSFSIDSGKTTFDRTYKFTAKAQDQYGLSDSTKEFVITVDVPNQKLYSNIKTQPLLPAIQRDLFRKFITNSDVFTSSSIYRPGDPNFGIRKDLAMTIYAGIETAEAAKYLGAMGLNHKRKRFQFGSIKKASSILNGTTVYEVVYIEMIDPMEPNGKVPGKTIKNNARDKMTLTADISDDIWISPDQTKVMELAESWLDRPVNSVTIDSSAYNISDTGPDVHYINSVSNWRKNLSDTGSTEQKYLPGWMRSIQPGEKQQLGFKLAVPLCYCLPGTADDIILNIKYSGFDFKTLDYTADRYIVDSVEGYSSDKYLVFKNHSTTV